MIEPIADSETKEERKKRFNRDRQQRYRERLNEEQQKLRLAAVAQAARERRAKETQQERELRQIEGALATKARRDRETETQRELRLAAVAQATRERRAKETQRQRELRQIEDALAAQARRDRETETQRELRLAAVAQAARERRAKETQQQGELRQMKEALETQARRDRKNSEYQQELTLAAVADDDGLSESSKASTTEIQAERRKEFHDRKSRTEYMKEYMKEYRRKRKFDDQNMELNTLLAKHYSDAYSCHPEMCARELRLNILKQKDKILKEYQELLEKRKTAESFQIIREYESRKPPLSSQVSAQKMHVDPEYIQKTVSENITLHYIPEVSPTQLIEYNEPQAIKTEVRDDASMGTSVLTNNLEESDVLNLDQFEDEAMETIYLSSDNEAADQSTTHEEDEMDSDTDKLLSIKTEPEMFQKNYGSDISSDGVRIKNEPKMLEEESIEWNAVQTPHPQAIKVESIEIKTEPHHMLENAQAEGNSGNGIAIKSEIITRENDERDKSSDEQRELMLNQNSNDACPPCSDINVPAESLGNYKSIFLFECSETVKMENDIHCEQQISSTKLPRTKEAGGHDFVSNDIDTLEEAMKLLEMLAIYAATTENCRAMIVLSQLEEALKEESN